MPAFNAGRFLGQALADLLAQTHGDFEIVLVDDGSTDDTWGVAEAHAARDGRIVLVRNEANHGIVRSLNRGLEHCRASIVARADADDRYPPERLERQLAFLAANPEVGLLSSAVQKIDEDGNDLLLARFPLTDGQIRLRELFVNSFSHPGAMFRKALVDEVGGYDPAFEGCEDADLWARLRERTKAANLAEPLIRYRKHGTSMVQTRNETVARKSLSVRQRLLAGYLERPVSIEEAGACQATFLGRATSSADVRAGRRGIAEVLNVARTREDASSLSYFRREVAQGLTRQAMRTARGKLPRLDVIGEALKYDGATVIARLPREIASLPRRSS
jgi:glycosyltransferase involved in cell wall biosynthesis